MNTSIYRGCFLTGERLLEMGVAPITAGKFMIEWPTGARLTHELLLAMDAKGISLIGFAKRCGLSPKARAFYEARRSAAIGKSLDWFHTYRGGFFELHYERDKRAKDEQCRREKVEALWSVIPEAPATESAAEPILAESPRYVYTATA